MPISSKRRTSHKKTITRLKIKAHHDRILREYVKWKANNSNPTDPEEIWVPPLQASSELVAQSVIRRDGSKCALCLYDGGMEENPLECVKVAWHTLRLDNPAEEKGMQWLKATRSISVDFSSQDPMNLVTLCYACSFHWENDNFRFIPSPRNIEAMMMSDTVDQILCERAVVAGQPLPPRVWPQLTREFEVYATVASNDISVFSHTSTDITTPYRPITLSINPYLALISAFEVALSPSSSRKAIDQRHADVQQLLERTLVALNSRLPPEQQLTVT